MNRGSLSTHMWLLVPFHHVIHLSTQHVVVSNRQEEKNVENGEMCMYVCVSADDSRGHSMFAHRRVHKRSTFSFVLLPVLHFRFLSSRFCLLAFTPLVQFSLSRFFLFVEMSLADTHLLLILSSYLFPRERYRTLETTYRISCQIQRRKSNSYRFQQAHPFDMALYPF